MFNLASKRSFGNELENFAAEQLKQQGCQIVDKNFNCKLGEIDIILMDNEVLVFVEVRYRKQNSFGGAVASVDNKKQRKLVKAASLYLQIKKITNRYPCRFDVFAIQGEPQRLKFDWIKDAFSA